MKKKINFYTHAALVFALILSGLQSFAGDAKLYVATNKESFAPTETVQFQLFLLNVSNANSTVYVELYDCKGNRLNKKMLPLTSSISWGSIELPENATAEFYILYCYVISADKVESDCSKKIFISNDNSANGNSYSNNFSINVFTEGGAFVEEMENNLLINCKDKNGYPIAVTGKIIDEKNNTMKSFTTNESGLAKFSFNPEQNVKYFIVTNNNQGKDIKKEMPFASQYGVNLSVAVNKDSLTYTVYSLEADANQLDYKLVILSDGKTIYKSDINFERGLSFIMETISLKDLAEGFLTFSLADKKGKISAQRIVYSDYKATRNTFLKIVDTVTKKTALVEVPSFVGGYPYVNMKLLNKSDSTAINLAAAGLKDIKEQPVIINVEGEDLNFNDYLITAGKTPPSLVTALANNKPFLTLSGIVTDSYNKPIKNTKINLVFLHKNLKKDYLVVTTDRSGSFEISSLIFYDSVTVYYQLADNSEGKNDIRAELKVLPAESFSGNPNKEIVFNCVSKQIPGVNENKLIVSNNILPDTAKFNKEKLLKEVTIKADKKIKKTETEKYIEQHVSGQHNQGNFLRNEFDFIANPQLIDNTNILSFLRGRFSLSITITTRGTVYMSNSSGDGVGVYLDDMEISDDLTLIQNMAVSDVALVRYYDQSLKPRMGKTRTKFGGGGIGGGDLMIYTKKGFTPTEQPVKGLPKTNIVGYAADNPEVNVQVSAGRPQSLYWKPNWIVPKDGIIYIGLPAGSTEKTIELIIEGVNTAQNPFSFTKNLVFN